MFANRRLGRRFGKWPFVESGLVDRLSGAPLTSEIPLGRFAEESKMYHRVQSNILLFHLVLAQA